MNHHFVAQIQACTNEDPMCLRGLICWGPKLYMGCIRINFRIEFLRTRNGNVIVFGMKYLYDM